jgi:putative Mg2+ transporter-C (MgtC) family protein
MLGGIGDLSDLDMALRLLIALGFGALIGLERELHKKTAGLRTHMLVSLSTCLLMILSVKSANELGGNADPTRIAAGVITGIGFLGAGSIIRHGASVQGLTTAASIWTAASVGLTTGAGYYVAASIVVVLTLFTLYAVERADAKLNIHKRRSNMLVTARAGPGFINQLDGVFADLGVDVGQFSVSLADHRAGLITLDIQIKEIGKHDRSEVVDRILQLPGVVSVEIY